MMSERGPAPYVHIEGMDLAGKTSATDLFIERRNEDWEVKRNSLSEDNPVRDLADAMLDSGEFSVETVGTVYAAALLADFDRFTRPDNPTVQESTIILRSIAYQAVNGTPRLTELFESLMEKHPDFDASFMLTASHEARMARLANQERHFTNHDLLIVRDPVTFFAMESLMVVLAKRHFKAEVIDTSTMPTDEVVETIEQQLQAKAVILSNRQSGEGE